MLVGESGVGKTAIAEGLAYLISNKNVPSIIENTTVYSLDIAALIAMGDIASGEKHSCGIKVDGIVECWGIDEGGYDDYGKVTDIPYMY